MGFSDHLPPSAGFCHVSGGGIVLWLVGWLGFYLFVCFVLLFLYTIVIIQHRKDYMVIDHYAKADLEMLVWGYSNASLPGGICVQWGPGQAI